MTDFETRERAWIALNRVRTRIYRDVERALVTAGLPKLNWYDVLWELEQHPDGLRPVRLEERLLFDQSSFSRQVVRMAEEGLLTREKAADDRRGKVLRITAKGREIRARMWVIYRPHIDAGMLSAIETGCLDIVNGVSRKN
ncbi:MarR family winged helix-turn-helix transcriptional regulator [Tropicibacter sp. Alg240-R139]|uniref:MarR family winged helix-turn-helix transcriptional regulator n=1 Tax=Tropicibacter sp. Alg240-R139 TaxID=2305991 RepID=UPI0013DE9171|nr:MarR family winged helix-turn-helix transcriptional regulator [Tropicibacter sp. Alg240-R139]